MRMKWRTMVWVMAACLAVACQKDDDDLATIQIPSTNEEEDDQTPVNRGDEPVLPTSWYNYANITLPAYMETPVITDQDNTPGDNPITDAGATLGRVLFYDRNLSFNNTVACASCHRQDAGFSDPDVLSTGFDGGLTGRHSMSLVNARYYTNLKFFWDERAATLEEQTLMPIQDHIEMGMTLTELETKLQTIEYYPDLFRDAFGDESITSDRVALALAQFVRAIVSFEAPYDEGRAGFAANQNPAVVDFPNFTAEENLGKAIFFDPRQGNCGACHGTEAFTAREATNNGLDLVLTDLGLGGVNGIAADEGKFKVPSLRNVALTAPYMHDGRFATLGQVIDHYSTGVQDHPNLDPALHLPNGQIRRLNLTEAEKAALIAFLETLTDPTIATDVRFSDPFIQ